MCNYCTTVPKYILYNMLSHESCSCCSRSRVRHPCRVAALRCRARSWRGRRPRLARSTALRRAPPRPAPYRLQAPYRPQARCLQYPRTHQRSGRATVAMTAAGLVPLGTEVMETDSEWCNPSCIIARWRRRFLRCVQSSPSRNPLLLPSPPHQRRCVRLLSPVRNLWQTRHAIERRQRPTARPYRIIARNRSGEIEVTLGFACAWALDVASSQGRQ